VDRGFLLIAILLVALLAIGILVCNKAQLSRQLFRADRKGTAPVPGSSTSSQSCALNRADTMRGPPILRTVEEYIPTIDEHGTRRILIRIRTLETVLGPNGPAEIERARRHTLPGHGHVYPISTQEYEVFHGRMRLRVDPEPSMAPRQRIPSSAPSHSVADAERIAAPSFLIAAPEGNNSWNPFLLYVVFIVLALAAVLWAPNYLQQPGPPSNPLTTAIDTPGSLPIAMESHRPDSTSLGEAQPMASPAEIPRIKARSPSASTRVGKIALAISPQGAVYVNGKRAGTSPPMKDLKLPPGTYIIEIRNDGFRPYRERIDLRSVSKAKIAYNFGETTKQAAKRAEPGSTFTTRLNTRLLSEEWPR
jgi:PEGA domain